MIFKANKYIIEVNTVCCFDGVTILVKVLLFLFQSEIDFTPNHGIGNHS